MTIPNSCRLTGPNLFVELRQSAEFPIQHKEVPMAHKHTVQLPRESKSAAAKETAARLAGKKSAVNDKTWTQSFAASGAKVGGKTGN